MAVIADIERRLHNWARWRTGVGSGLGFARADMAAERVDGEGWDCQAVIPTSDVEASETDAAISALGGDLKYVIVWLYAAARPFADVAQRLGITTEGVRQRRDTAQRRIAGWLADKAERARAERDRVEALQRDRAA